MKSELIVEAIGGIDDAFIQRASTTSAKVLKFEWVKWAAVAACVLIAVLIAVPALKGQAPEVEPEPVEPTPIEEPIDEPTNEPNEQTDYSNIEPMRFVGSLGPAGSEVGADSTDEAFLKDYAAVIENPVFAALFAAEDIRDQYAIYYLEAWDDWDASCEFVVLQNEASGDGASIHHMVYKDETDDMYEGLFAKAEELGVRTDYVVDGIEVQKYNERDAIVAKGGTALEEPLENPDNDPAISWTNFTEHMAYNRYARVNVDGTWYVVYGSSEPDVDALATALAHIASTL